MGVVYRAEDVRLGRQVAVKALPPEMARHADRLARVRLEARSLAALNHPCIVTLYAVEELDDQLLLVMELVEGATLAESIPAGGFELERFFRLALPLVDAVAAAHERGIVHRDLKPGNILLTPQGRAKILDFGLAKLRSASAVAEESTASTAGLTVSGAVVGTPSYMAPEQIRGSPADERTDVFSLGILLYQMASGRHPFQGPSPSTAEVISSILRDDPPSLPLLRPGAPRELDRILRAALEKDPERRCQSAKELRNQLESLEHERVRSGSWERGSLAAWLPRRRPARAALAAGLLAALLGVLWALRRPAPAPAALPYLAVAESRRFSGDTGPDYFRSGLVRALAERLERLEGVWTVPPEGDPLPDLVVEVDARRAGEAVALRFRIRDSSSRGELGEGILEGSAADPFGLLDRAGAAIVRELRRKPGIDVRYPVAPAAGADAAAFDLHLQAQAEAGAGAQPADLVAALALAQGAVRADPGFVQARALEGELWRRRSLETGDPLHLEQAAAACRQAADLDPGSPDAHLCLARVRHAQHQPLEAQQEYLRAIELRPGLLDAYHELRRLFVEMGLPADAERAWRRVIDRHPSWWAGHWALGGFESDRERWPAAAEHYRRALELGPRNAAVELTLGMANYFMGRYEEAITAWQASIAIRDNYAAYTNLGAMHLLLRRFPEAVESLERAAQFPEASYVSLGNLAAAYHWAPGRRRDAAPAFERAAALCRRHLESQPQSAGAWVWLALDTAMLARPAESRAALARALALQPSDPHYFYLAAVVHSRLGEERQALDWLERARQGGYPLTEIRLNVEFDNLRDEPRFRALLAGSERLDPSPAAPPNVAQGGQP
jgi:non-specific serine/threonine protein kinase